MPNPARRYFVLATAAAAIGAMAFTGQAVAAPSSTATTPASEGASIMAWALHSTHPTEAQCDAAGQELQKSGQYRHYLCLQSDHEWGLWVHP